MTNLSKMMKTAQEMQAKMEAAQKEFETVEVEGYAGGGMGTITMNLKGALRRVKIDPSLMKPEEAEILEDLLVAAANDGKAKAEAEISKRMSEIAGGLELPPGMKPSVLIVWDARVRNRSPRQVVGAIARSRPAFGTPGRARSAAPP